jgi:ribosome-associated protein
MRKVANFCDYFVICTGTSDRQVRALGGSIEEELGQSGLRVYHKQGYESALWMLLDLGDVVVHIFEPETRAFYGLEHLWQEAKTVKWQT